MGAGARVPRKAANEAADSRADLGGAVALKSRGAGFREDAGGNARNIAAARAPGSGRRSVNILDLTPT